MKWVACFLSLTLLTSCGLADPDVVRVGSKAFTEGALLGYMELLVLQGAGLKVEDRIEMGPTLIVRQALLYADIDTYVEYTGTALVNFFHLADPALLSDSAKGIAAARKHDAPNNLIWLKPWALNNTYTVLMTRKRALEHGIRNIGDLAKMPGKLTFGSDSEFAARSDGLPGLRKAYGLTLEVKQLTGGLIYPALGDGMLDAAIGYSTDGRIPAFDLVRLTDDRQYFPAYHPAPVFRAATLKRHPAIQPALDALADNVTDEAITALNYEVDVDRGRAKDVARRWLLKQCLLK